MRPGMQKVIKRALFKAKEMPVDHVWLLPAPGRASKMWTFSSWMTLTLVTAISKVWLGWFNKPVVYRKQVLLEAVDKRESHRPLISTCNHYSTIDDPVLAYMLSWRHIWNMDSLRWLPGAKDICNKTFVTSLFFQLGKVIPVVRGDGVYQSGMNFCLDRLNEGKWVHIYPEGKINMKKEKLRLKWGIGRLIADSKVCPVVLPYWHMGLEEVLPPRQPYILQRNKNITVLIGEPLDFEQDLICLREENKSEEEIRKHITDRVQDVFMELKLETERLHNLRLKTKRTSALSNN